jgi:hypothetical protein
MADNGSEKKLFQEAEAWILDKSSDWLFSFENICDELGATARLYSSGITLMEGGKA